MNPKRFEQPRLGDGVYTLADVSRILGVTRARTQYWFGKYAKDLLEEKTGYRYYFGDDRNYINFKSLIQFYIFIRLRQLSIRAPKIVEAYQVLSNLLNDPYPFTRSEECRRRNTRVGES